MISSVRLARPSRATLDAFLASAEARPLSYDELGMTERPAPAGYRTLDASVEIGAGTDVFRRAAEALAAWSMLDLGWVCLYPDRPIPRDGLTVVVAARTLGAWTLNPTRIVRMIDDEDRRGFAYGTVEGHAVSGEERFLVTIDDMGAVRYRITAHSRVRLPLGRVLPPFARAVQRRFAAASMEAMRAAVPS